MGTRRMSEPQYKPNGDVRRLPLVAVFGSLLKADR
jgi:hypothetical protein